MNHAFDTLSLELERLILLRESMTNTGNTKDINQVSLSNLDRKIYSHEKAIKVITRISQAEEKIVVIKAPKQPHGLYFRPEG